MSEPRFEVFEGEICGFGTASGHRVVVGRWPESPFGAFADVMHEDPDGVRTLLAPTEQVAEFVQGTYRFDEVKIVPVVSDRSTGSLKVEAGHLAAEVTVGSRSAIGYVLRAVPRPVARSRAWCTAVDPVARLVMRGVRTRGTAGNGRREWYGATDAHRVTAVNATFDRQDLGELSDVWPPVRFGFSSTPRSPSIVSVTTTIELAADR